MGSRHFAIESSFKVVRRLIDCYNRLQQCKIRVPHGNLSQ